MIAICAALNTVLPGRARTGCCRPSTSARTRVVTGSGSCDAPINLRQTSRARSACLPWQALAPYDVASVSLSPGVCLGAYEIVALVGAGGMGEVYRARDTRLDRTVAIKCAALGAGRRFATARALRPRGAGDLVTQSSAHPHICTLFDVGHQDPSAGSGQAGIDYLVLEYLEGETLAERLAREGALDPNAALQIAIHILDRRDSKIKFERASAQSCRALSGRRSPQARGRLPPAFGARDRP